VLIEIAIYQYYLPRCQGLGASASGRKGAGAAYGWYRRGVCESRMGLGKHARSSFSSAWTWSPNAWPGAGGVRELDGGEGSFKSVFGKLFGRG